MPTTMNDVLKSIDAVKGTFQGMILDVLMANDAIHTITIDTSPSNHDDGDYSARCIQSVAVNGEYIFGGDYYEDEDEEENDDDDDQPVKLLGENAELLDLLWLNEYRWASSVNYPKEPERNMYETWRDYQNRSDVTLYNRKRKADYKAYLDQWFIDNADIAWLGSLALLENVDGELLPAMLPEVDGTLVYERNGLYSFSDYDYSSRY